MTGLNDNGGAAIIDVKSSIMSGMSHEMRTQMNSIISLAFLLKDSSLNEVKKNDLVNHIHMTCKQMITVFENFTELEFSINKNTETEEEKCSVIDLLAMQFEEFRTLLISSGKQGIELINEIPNIDLSEIIISKTNVHKILRCLYNNALHNTEFGYIKIGFSKNNSQLTFYVLDSGNAYEKTNKFFQSNDIKSSLELFNDLYSAVNISLAKKLIYSLNGSIDIKSNGANGSGVYFTIPVKNSAMPKSSFYKFVNSILFKSS